MPSSHTGRCVNLSNSILFDAQQGDHEGHDYLIYESGSGGCCDCGDINAIAAEGWCSKHRCASTSGADSGAGFVDDDYGGLTPAVQERVVLLLAVALRRLQDTLVGGHSKYTYQNVPLNCQR